VRLFGLGELFRGLYRDLRFVLRRERIGIAGRRALADFAGGAVAVLAIFDTFAYIAWRTISVAISLGSMGMHDQAFQTGLSSLQRVLGGLAGLDEDSLFLTYGASSWGWSRGCSSAIASAPCARSTASTYSTAAASSRAAPTTSSSRSAAAARTRTKCRPGRTTRARGTGGYAPSPGVPQRTSGNLAKSRS
jgi:hypothetical protein